MPEVPWVAHCALFFGVDLDTGPRPVLTAFRPTRLLVMEAATNTARSNSFWHCKRFQEGLQPFGPGFAFFFQGCRLLLPSSPPEVTGSGRPPSSRLTRRFYGKL